MTKATINLPEILDASCREDLVALLRSQPGAAIEASKVGILSTSCVEALISARRSGYAIKEPSDDFIATFKELGLEDFISDWMTEV
jgi:hypothetical protein